MRWIRNFAVILILMWIVDACLKEPENSVIPQIKFVSIDFKKGYPNADDTLTVKLDFTDGDGDLGLSPDETAIYTSAVDSTDINTPFYYVYDTSQNTTWFYTHLPNVSLPKGYKYVNYASFRTIHTLPFDTLPGVLPLSCKDWEYRNNPADTLYKQDNPYNSNFFMDIYTKNPDGTYTYFDINSYFTFGGCQVTQNRFPILSSDLGKNSSLDGTITYKYISAGVYIIFKGKTIKTKIYILDRAFHKSNLVESDDLIIPN